MFTLTTDILKHIAPQANAALLPDLAKYLPIAMEKFEITTLLRAAHFLGQCAEESAGYRTLTEYATGREYENRHDLGNDIPGYGVRYKGRGLLQITGYYNYNVYGKKLGVDFVHHPELAAAPQYAALTAAQFWTDHHLNTYADQNDIETITKRINGGFNGLADRRIFVGRATAILKPLFAHPDALVAAKPDDTSGDIVVA